MPGGRHVSVTVEPGLTVADIIAARNDYNRRSKSRADSPAPDTSQQWVVGAFVAAVVLSVVIGSALPPHAPLNGFKGRLSNILGWGYLACWAFAEYPPLYFNHRQRASSGDSLDQIVYYLIGDASYTAFTTILLWSPICKKAGGGCHGRAEGIHLNDALFSLHSTACTLALLGQLLAYSPRRVELSLQCWVVIVSVAVLGGGGLVLALQDSNYLGLPSYLYGISFLRVGSCVMEQMPGAEGAPRPNSALRRRSSLATHWPLLVGGALSLSQQVFDAAASGVWAIVYSNLTKLLLAALTCAFSCVMLFREHEVAAGIRAAAAAGGEPPEAAGRERDDRERTDALVEALLE